MNPAQSTLLSNMRLVKAGTGVGYIKQAADLLPILMRRYNLGVADYYAYGLHGVPRDRWRSFTGWRYELEPSLVLNERHGTTLCWDKLLCHEILHSQGYPVAPIKAIFRPGGTTCLPGVHLKSTAELRNFLASPGADGCFVKPAHSQQGVDSLVLGSGRSESDIDGIVASMTRADTGFYRGGCGWLFQGRLKAHPRIAAYTGNDRISGLRVVVLNLDGNPRVIKGLFKINAGQADVDNFQRGALGNLLRPVDVETGEAGAPIAGIGPQYLRHPLDPRWREAFQVPDWPETVALVQRASSILPLVRLQHFDVALTDDGPKLLEINDLGATIFHQLQGEGFITGELREALGRMNAHPGYLWVRQYRKWLGRL